MTRKLLLYGALALAPVGAGTAFAHHSFAMFDVSKTETISGTVKVVKWVNPHVFIELMVADPHGAQSWALEGGAPSQLSRLGFTKDMLVVGTKLDITINPMRDNTHGGSLISIKFPDGRVMRTKSTGGDKPSAY